MLTPQEVSSHAFTKQVMGGYNMTMVDEFLDELTDDYTSLYKENAALKAKLKVLVEKVEDYRATEDSMRATLLTAQKMADSIVHEAEQKRDELLRQAEQGAHEKIEQLRAQLNETESRLHAGQSELAEFVEASRALCGKQLDFLNKLPQLPVEPVQQTKPVPVEEIEEQVLATFGQVPAAEPVREAPAAAVSEPAPVAEAAPAAAEPLFPEGDPFAAPSSADEVSEPTRRINLDELKFGRNYNGD